MLSFIKSSSKCFQVPSGDILFYSRKKQWDINCLLTAGASRRIFNCVSDWPGSAHDARIFSNSELYEALENGYRPFKGGILIGDSAFYAFKAYMAKPLKQSELGDPVLARFNKDFCRARVKIENVIGILKARWRILANGLTFKDMKLCSKVIQCMCALHNLILENKENNPPPDMKLYTDALLPESDDEDFEEPEEVEGHQSGKKPKKEKVRTSMKIVDKYYR